MDIPNKHTERSSWYFSGHNQMELVIHWELELSKWDMKYPSLGHQNSVVLLSGLIVSSFFKFELKLYVFFNLIIGFVTLCIFSLLICDLAYKSEIMSLICYYREGIIYKFDPNSMFLSQPVSFKNMKNNVPEINFAYFDQNPCLF